MRFSREYTVKFTVPAFLGDAGQAAAWRTPPFKALLRQWWRVAAARDYGFDHQKLREAEGKLFGHAWLTHQGEHWSMQSRLRISLRDISAQKPSADWPPQNQRFQRLEAKHGPLADLYLGYGPILNRGRESTRLKDGRFVLPQSAAATLRLRSALSIDDQTVKQLTQTMQLVHWFGTVGGRSRNAWGSLTLEHSSLYGLALAADLKDLSRPLAECLKLEWPHALGTDAQGVPLIWQTRSHATWQHVIADLAQVKADLLRSLDRQDGVFSERQLLSYPVNHGKVKSWPQEARLANQLRLKIVPAEGGFCGICFHVPCGLAASLRHKLPEKQREWLKQNEQTVWKKVHRFLDQRQECTRFGEVVV